MSAFNFPMSDGVARFVNGVQEQRYAVITERGVVRLHCVFKGGFQAWIDMDPELARHLASVLLVVADCANPTSADDRASEQMIAGMSAAGAAA